MSQSFHIFISYDRADSKQFAIKLYNDLIATKYEVWFDQKDIPPRVDFQQQIYDGIDASDNFIFIISPHSVASEYCLKEIKYALKRNKRIIPLLHIPAEKEQDKMHFRIGELNWIYFDGADKYSDSLNLLNELLDSNKEYVSKHKEILVDALQWEESGNKSTHLLHGFELEKAEKWIADHKKRTENPPTGLHKRFIDESRKSRVSVFLSYGRRHSLAFARKLYEKLNANGYNVWFDMNDIPLGVDFQEQIDAGIENADNFIFVISPHSVASEYCLKEVVLAIHLKKRIIPILHIDPADVWDQMHPVIGKLNWVYMREEENFDIPLEDWNAIDDHNEAYKGLHQLMQLNADYVKKHTHFLGKALEWQRNNKNPKFLIVGNERGESEEWLKTKFTKTQAPCHPTELHANYLCESKKNATNMMTDVFISYSRDNDWEVMKIRNAIHHYAITTWADNVDIEKGEQFAKRIDEGIEQADNLLFLISPSSIQSEYCIKELQYANSLNKRIIPILVEAVDNNLMPKELKEIQYINFCDSFLDVQEVQKEFSSAKEKIEKDVEQRKGTSNFDVAIGELLQLIERDKEYYYEHKVFLSKALKWEKQKKNESILLRGFNLQNAEMWLETGLIKTRHTPLPIQQEFIRKSRDEESDVTTEVFISYSRANADFGRKLNNELQTHRKTTWFDQESIAKGVDFAAEINKGIETSDNFLFVISPRSINSEYCDMEVEYAKKNNKRVITILLEDIDIEDLNPELAAINWIDFRPEMVEFSTAFGELLQTLNQDREHVQNHTRWLNKAKEWNNTNRDKDRLLRGEEYINAGVWLDTAITEKKTPRPTKLQKEFIDESEKALMAQRRYERRILILKRLGIAAILLLAVASILLGIRAQIKSVQAEKSAQEAMEERKVAIKAKDEAIKAKEEAEVAKEEALKAKNRAEQASNEAIAARKDADQKRREANDAKEDAEQKQIAAERAEKKALQKEKEAKEANIETIAANKKAMFHLYAFNAKEFANKSISKQAYNEKLKEEKALLALTAIDLENVADTFGFHRDYAPELLEGLQKAYLEYQSDKLIDGETWALSQQGDAFAYSNSPGNFNISRLIDKSTTAVKQFELIKNIKTKYKEQVRDIHFCGSSDIFAMGTSLGNIYLYKKNNAEYSFNKLYNYSRQWVLSMTYIAEMNLLATAANDGNWTLYNVEENFTLNQNHAPSPILSICSAGNLLYTGDKSGNILEYKIDSKLGITEKAKTLFANKHTTINALKYNDKKQWLIAGLSDGNILKYRPEQDSKLTPLPIKHKGLVSSIAFSPDNNWLATGGYDGIVMLWYIKDLENTDDLVPIIIENEKRKIISLSFDKDNQYLIYGDNQRLHIFPIDIDVLYNKLDKIMNGKRLNDKEWEYYKKGDLQKPSLP